MQPTGPEVSYQIMPRSENFPDIDIVPFIRESLMIEGIHRDPTSDEIQAFRRFMSKFTMSNDALNDLQVVYAPGMPLRGRVGMNVRVGQYVAPEGGPLISERLKTLCRKANNTVDSWALHVEFEALHPYLDGNGRTGRALWAWHMHGRGQRPFSLSFLHRFYYQTLADRGPSFSAKWHRS